MHPMDFYYTLVQTDGPGVNLLITSKEHFDQSGMLTEDPSLEPERHLQLHGFKNIGPSRYHTDLNPHEAHSFLDGLGLTPNRDIGLTHYFKYLKQNFETLSPVSVKNIYHLLKQI